MEHKELIKTLKKLEACDAETEWVRNTPGTSAELWQKCENGGWMWWLLRQTKMPTKKQSVAFAKRNARAAKKYAADAAAAADAAYATAAADERKAQADYIRKHFECPL